MNTHLKTMMRNNPVRVIGAGLAGCEAAWQIATRGIPVVLQEMKPEKRSPAHQSPLFAELVCSNSLRSDRLQNAVGLLKEELRRLNSLVLKAADATRVPAGGALAVDREAFSGYITQRLENHPLITIDHSEAHEFPQAPCVIATGPLTSDAFSQALAQLPEMTFLNFYDAAAPIVTLESINMDRAFRASRYGRGDDYLNCPMTEEEYHHFVSELIQAETAPIHGFEETKVFEGCMPVESMARRGAMSLAFGPMKPVGLVDPRSGKMPFAVLQLRQDDAGNSLYNLVGFQTRLKFGEQKRVFGLIPGLEHAEFARYGVMHRNTFVNGPQLLNAKGEMLSRPMVYMAGQMTGVEGYVESAASGWMAGFSLACAINGEEAVHFPSSTALGALGRYISTPNRHYQPMNITFGLMDELKQRIRNKEQRYTMLSQNALNEVDRIAEAINVKEPLV